MTRRDIARPDDGTDLAAWLRDLGVDADEVGRAEADGTLPLLALEQTIEDEPATYDIETLAELSGVEPEVIRWYWRALGFADPPPGHRLFTAADLAMVGNVARFVDDETVDRDLVLQMTRVIGSSMERIASAQVDAIATGADLDDDERRQVDLEAVQRGAELLPMMPGVMDYVWRRHLAAVARRRRLRAAARDVDGPVCVGFADMVGFTAQTRQLPDHELAEVVSRFESIAYDLTAQHGGRVVKMIGDAAMFLCESARAGGDLALALAEAYRAEDALTDVRVGLASGPVLEREGDVYGPVVNLAARIVSIAYPGAVVVSEEVHRALADDPEFTFASIRQHYLKDIGRVPLWTMRRAGDETYERYRRARDRRAARRDFMLRRRAERLMGEDGEGPMRLSGLVVTGDEPTGELEAIAGAVLDADLDEDLQVELLADLEAARRLAQLEREAQAKADEADLEAEDKLERIEREAKRKVEQIEAEAHRRIEEALRQAEEQAARANEEAARKVKRVAEEAERKAEQAERDARRQAKRKAARSKAERAKKGKKASDADGG